MTRYLIKTTYVSGPHEGKVFYLTKGGYVTDLDRIHFESDTYKTEGIARNQCLRLAKNNAADYRAERSQYEYDKKRGKERKSPFIHEKEFFEPIAVETIPG